MITARPFSSLVKRKPFILIIILQFLILSVIWKKGYWSRAQRNAMWQPLTFWSVSLMKSPPAYLALAEECHEWRKNVTSKCHKLFRGEHVSLNYSDFQNGSIYFDMKSKCSFQNILDNHDCSALKAINGYVTMDQVSEEEKNFPIAFTIKMHKSPSQAEQMLRILYRPHNVYCVYIDKKAPSLVYQDIKQLAQCFDNIIVIEDRLDIVYGSILHVTSEIACMNAVRKSKKMWKYYINLTGQEFPLKTNKEIVEILKSLHGANDIESAKFPSSLLFRIQKSFNITDEGLINTHKPKKVFPHNIEFRKGSAYGAMTRQFVEFVLRSKISRELITWLNDTLAPEETVWSTLNALPEAPGGSTHDTSHPSGNFLSRAMIWMWDKEKCRGKFVHSVCIYGVKDLTWLKNSPKLIANKFNQEYDPLVLDCMEDSLRSRSNTENDIDNLNWFYYRNLPHAKQYDDLKGHTNLTSHLKH